METVWYRQLLDDRQPARFEVKSTLDEAIARLAAATERSRKLFSVTEYMFGRVSAPEVRLERVMPTFRNSWKPVFTGHFIEANGTVVLIGTFGAAYFTRIFMHVFVAFGVLWSIGAFWSLHKTPGQQLPPWFPFAGLGMATLGLVISRIFERISRGDVIWLSDRIAGALGGRAS
jgi:hypothetical protein